jgi:type IV pilus assembly protein PilM
MSTSDGHMIAKLKRKRFGPIGVDLGSRSIKLIQFSGDQSRIVDAVRWELPLDEEAAESTDQRWQAIGNALRRAREGRNFRGREAVVCLGAPELFVQNVRVAKVPSPEIQRVVNQEAAGRIPFPAAEAEIRFLEAADVRQGETTRREVVLLACHKPVIERLLGVVVECGLEPQAIDVEPAAVLRCYAKQFRRDDDQNQRALFAHIGSSGTIVVIAKGADALFIKYIDVGGRQMDESVARHLDMTLGEASALRRHNGDRRVDQQDPEITRSVAEAVRPVVERLANELSLCARYHSVTFRGQPIARAVFSGGEANQSLLDVVAARVDLKCELGDPLRSYESATQTGRKGIWDVATGLALRNVETE